MSDTERGKKPHLVRRNPPSRPPPGVQKAMHNFGVRDLREILDKKHQEEHGESPNDTEKKLPPPDPSYNYLKDPERDHPSSPPHKREPKKPPQQLYQNPKLNRSKTEPTLKNDSPSNNNDNDKSLEGESATHRGRGSFRGRGRPARRAQQCEKIENPINIQIKLSTETGKRSCVLDESTQIADIKHIPDNSPLARPLRGNLRGGRGRGRGRGGYRGRGRSFRGRGGFNRGGEHQSSEADDALNDGGHDNNEQVPDQNENGFSSEYHDEKVEGDNGQLNSGFDANLAETFTITSSDFGEGEESRVC